VGLRERTRLLGGAFAYEAVDGAGFRVTAHLPSSKEAAS
jgi:signal transduction histidine kinase